VDGGTTIAPDPVRVLSPATITVLVILNLVLQLFDGIATYIGWERVGEANPLLRTAFVLWGAGPTLLVAKLGAAALLLVLARTPCRNLLGIGLAFTLGVYTALSLVPWSIGLLG
jgi:hypothetical protein